MSDADRKPSSVSQERIAILRSDWHGAMRCPGSARVSRVGFGVSPKRSSPKVRESGTLSPTRETCALPGINVHCV
ncbi:MAG: hypothetical protein DMF19_05035 [Verrucomicrobia bacterium]|nr:MAG: hypothetical protein DMF19_05035 [Verrucomicrobiota bacterium]